MSTLKYVLYGLLILVVLSLIHNIYVVYNIASEFEGFGRDNKPFEPDNSSMGNNPWDNIDYIVPSYII